MCKLYTNKNKNIMTSNSPQLSIIIPAYNEELRIGRTLQNFLSFFESEMGQDFELIVVLNGCRDNTLDVVNAFSKYSQLKIANFSNPIGKGGAIAQGMKLAKGKYIGYVDADSSTCENFFNKLFQTLKHFEDHTDCVIGSRNLANSIVHGKLKIRSVMTSGFRFGVNLLLRLNIRDTQCGAKVITRKALDKVLPEMVTANMAFDVNLLLLLKKAKMHTIEMPITWVDDNNSTIKKPIKTVLIMALAVVRLWLMYLPTALFYRSLQPLGSQVWRLLLNTEQIHFRKIIWAQES